MSLLNVVLVEEDQRKDFAVYIKKLMKGKASPFHFKTFKSKNMSINCTADYMHVDDELVLPFRGTMTVEVRENALEFLMGGKR